MPNPNRALLRFIVEIPEPSKGWYDWYRKRTDDTLAPRYLAGEITKGLNAVGFLGTKVTFQGETTGWVTSLLNTFQGETDAK